MADKPKDSPQIELTPKQVLFSDLLKAQAEIEKVDKDANNPFFKHTYTTLTATIAACKEALNKHNLVVLQPIESDGTGVYVCTTLIHTNGEAISSKMLINQARPNDPQAQGSAITYARRYSLKALLCMADDDDDAEAAMPPRYPNRPATTKPEREADWIEGDTKPSLPKPANPPGVRCELCGAVGKYHKKGCPNA